MGSFGKSIGMKKNCMSIGWIRSIDSLFHRVQATDSFNYVISSGRDRRIYKTDLRDPAGSTSLITEEKHSVLKFCPTPDFSAIWVATEESSINYYVS